MDDYLALEKAGYDKILDLRRGADAGGLDQAIKGGTRIIRNWKGEEVKIPDGHVMNPRDPDFSAKPIIGTGPYTSTQKDEFLAGNLAGTKLAPHHRHQIPVRDGGIYD